MNKKQINTIYLFYEFEKSSKKNLTCKNRKLKKSLRNIRPPSQAEINKNNSVFIFVIFWY